MVFQTAREVSDPGHVCVTLFPAETGIWKYVADAVAIDVLDGSALTLEAIAQGESDRRLTGAG
jgi:hypothetical protein